MHLFLTCTKAGNQNIAKSTTERYVLHYSSVSAIKGKKTGEMFCRRLFFAGDAISPVILSCLPGLSQKLHPTVIVGRNDEAISDTRGDCFVPCK
jgi:hypothetical protein